MISGTGPYQTGISDLQTLLSDGPTDRYNFLHRCFGQVDGVNTVFKTFWRRRVTNFTSATGSVAGVFLNGVLLAASGVSSDDVESGVFVLATAPTPDKAPIEASYYNYWFDQGELDTFLQVAARWINSNNDYTQTDPGLVDALLKYAAAEAFLKMAQRWRTYMSQEYKVEDAPKDSPNYSTDSFLKMSQEYREEALKTRTEFFQTRQGRALQPLFGSIGGRIRSKP